jgi:GT2 family glycosyltransferase
VRPSSTKSPSLSIIIATKDRLDHLRDCVESILKQTVLPDQVTIVDGSTQQDLMSAIESLFRNAPHGMLRYVKSLPSLAVQNNLGIRNSTCDLITILDDDVILDRNYVSYVKDFFCNNSDSKIGALSTKMLDRETRTYEKHLSLSELIGKIFMLWHIKNGRFQLSGIPTLISPDCNEVKKVDFIFGGNATYPRHILEEYKFDECLPMGFMMSDDDLAYRISRKYNNYWTPHAIVFHRSNLVGNNRYSKSKQFILTHAYLRKKNHPHTLAHAIPFYWSIFGKIVLEGYISVKNRNVSGLKGTLMGLYEVMFNIPPKNV